MSRRPYRHAPVIYFIRPIGRCGPVKIGVTTKLEWRLVDLNAMSPVKLEVWIAFEGSHKLERQFHAYFADTHCHSEWFNWSPKMEATAQSIINGTFNTDALPAGKLVGYASKRERPLLELVA
jgi:hypothetical protein